MGFATVETGHQTASKGGDVRIIRTEVLGGTLVNVYQTTVTETERYVGLTETDAKNLASTGSGGLVKSNLGGVRITVSSGTASYWFSIFGCRGTIETATASRDGDSELWVVNYQKQTLSVTADGGTIANI